MSGGRRILRQLSSGDLGVARGARQWDSTDGHAIVCFVCGIVMGNLGSRGANHENHLLAEHEMTPEQYQAYCDARGWGRPPVTSLHCRNQRAERRREHPEEVKKHNQLGEEKRAARRKIDVPYARKYWDKIRRRRQRRLTDEDKAKRIQCPLMNADGSPCGAWELRLGRHVADVHGMSRVAFERAYPDVPWYAPDEARRAGGRLAGHRQTSAMKTPRNVGGRPTGMTRTRQQEGETLVRLMSEFESREGTKRGALRFAARKVYSRIDLHIALDRAKKTLAKYRKIEGIKLV